MNDMIPSNNAAEQVSMPAMGLMITGILGLVGNVLLLLLHFGAMAISLPFSGGPGMGGMLAGTIGMVFRIMGLGASGFVLYGASQMKGLNNYTMAIAAAVCAVIPCFFPCPCCFVGIGAGIWAIIVLIKPEVKAAFAQK